MEGGKGGILIRTACSWGVPGSPSRPQSAGAFSRGPTAGAQAQRSRGGRWARASSGARQVSTRAPSAVPGAPVGARAPPGSPPRPNGFLCLRLPTESGRDTAVPPQGRGAPFVFLDRWVPIALTRVRSGEGEKGHGDPTHSRWGGYTHPAAGSPFPRATVQTEALSGARRLAVWRESPQGHRCPDRTKIITRSVSQCTKERPLPEGGCRARRGQSPQAEPPLPATCPGAGPAAQRTTWD